MFASTVTSTRSVLFTSLALLAFLAISPTACGGSTSESNPLPTGDDDDASASQDASHLDTDASAGESDATVGPEDAGKPPVKDAAPGTDAAVPSDPTDGTPTPHACTNGLGSGLSNGYGRLDGTLAAKQCGAVSDHLHLQVWMNNASYDVAINLDTLVAEKDAPLPGAAWSEGWHAGGSLDYTKAFGMHSTDFTQPASMPELATKIENMVANANHISIYATGYGPDGIHDVHRKYSGSDGVIIIHPLSATAHMMMFRFTNDVF